MIKIANYSLIGNTCVLKLKCSCGFSRILEVEEEGQTYYFCGKCRARKTLRQLKEESSTYWQGREWKVQCEADERVQPRIHTEHEVLLKVRATRYSPPYCELHGEIVVLSESGCLALVRDFKKEYFDEISTVYRNVVINFVGPSDGVLPSLGGRIVAVRFTQAELPRARVAIGFEGLNEDKLDALQAHIAEHVDQIAT